MVEVDNQDLLALVELVVVVLLMRRQAVFQELSTQVAVEELVSILKLVEQVEKVLLY